MGKLNKVIFATLVCCSCSSNSIVKLSSDLHSNKNTYTTRFFNVETTVFDCATCPDSVLLEINSRFYNKPLKFGHYEIDIFGEKDTTIYRDIKGNAIYIKLHKKDYAMIYLEAGKKNMVAILDNIEPFKSYVVTFFADSSLLKAVP